MDGVSGLHERRPSDDPDVSGRLLLAASAVTLALAGAFFFLPLLYAAPAPLAALVYRYGYRTGIVTAIVILVVVGAGQKQLFGDPSLVVDEASGQALFLVAMTVLITVGLIGLVLGGAWREGASRWQADALGVLGAVAPAYGLASVFWLFRGVDLLQLVFDAWLQVMRGEAARIVGAGVSPEAAAGVLDMLADIEAAFPFMKPMFPGVVAVAALVGVHLNGRLAAWSLSRNDPPPNFSPFATWKFPWPFALVFVFGHGLTLAAKLGAGPVLGLIGDNLLLVTGFLFTVQGLAIVLHGFGPRRLGLWLRAFAAFALFWLWPAALTWLGVLDTWFHFRTRDWNVPAGKRGE